MTTDLKISLKIAALRVGALISIGGMYLSYKYLKGDADLIALAIGLLGVVAGYFLSESSSVKNESQLDSILNTSLIKEKEIEVKTVQEANAIYQAELGKLKETVEQEGHKLLVQRLREVYLSDIREKLREIDSLDDEISKFEDSPPTPEIAKLREKLAGLLAGVRNPEEDDRLIRQLCYAIPFFGNTMYLLYAIWKKADPTIQEKLHRKIDSLASRRIAEKTPRGAGAVLMFVFLVGVISIIVFVYRRIIY